MSDESADLEEKKEKMRQYMAADRAMDDARARRGRRGGGGCIFGLLKMAAFIALLGLAGYGIWLWHPWSTEVVTEDSADCSPGVSGTQTTEYFTLFGIRLYQSGQSNICME